LGCSRESTTVSCLLCWEGWIWSHAVWQLEKQVPKNSGKRGNADPYSYCWLALLLIFNFRVQGCWINTRACMSCWLIPFPFKSRSKHELNCFPKVVAPIPVAIVCRKWISWKSRGASVILLLGRQTSPRAFIRFRIVPPRLVLLSCFPGIHRRKDVEARKACPRASRPFDRRLRVPLWPTCIKSNGNNQRLTISYTTQIHHLQRQFSQSVQETLQPLSSPLMSANASLLAAKKKRSRIKKAMDQLGLVEQKLSIQQVQKPRKISCNFWSFIHQPEDWFTVALTEAYEMGLSKRLIKNSRQLTELLQEKYPSLQWDKMGILKGKFGQQRRLERAIAALFPVLVPHLQELSKI